MSSGSDDDCYGGPTLVGQSNNGVNDGQEAKEEEIEKIPDERMLTLPMFQHV